MAIEKAVGVVAGGILLSIGAAVTFIREVPIASPEFSILPSSLVGILGVVAAFLAILDAIHRRVSDPASKVAEAAARERGALEDRLAIKVTSTEERCAARHETLLERMTDNFARLAEQRTAGLSRLDKAEEWIDKFRIQEARDDERYKNLTTALEKWEALIDKWRERDEEKYENILEGFVRLGGGQGGRHRRKDDPNDDAENVDDDLRVRRR